MRKIIILSLLTFLVLLQVTKAENSSALSAIPDTITKTVNGIEETTIEIENSGDSEINISEVIVVGDIIGIVSIVDRPYVIQPNSYSNLQIRIDPSNLPQGSYSGTISILSSAGIVPINVNLEVPYSSQDYSYIIWIFAAFIIVAIVVITILRYRKLKKRKKRGKEEGRGTEKERRESLLQTTTGRV